MSAGAPPLRGWGGKPGGPSHACPWNARAPGGCQAPSPVPPSQGSPGSCLWARGVGCAGRAQPAALTVSSPPLSPLDLCPQWGGRLPHVLTSSPAPACSPYRTSVPSTCLVSRPPPLWLTFSLHSQLAVGCPGVPPAPRSGSPTASVLPCHLPSPVPASADSLLSRSVVCHRGSLRAWPSTMVLTNPPLGREWRPRSGGILEMDRSWLRAGP